MEKINQKIINLKKAVATQVKDLNLFLCTDKPLPEVLDLINRVMCDMEILLEFNCIKCSTEIMEMPMGEKGCYAMVTGRYTWVDAQTGERSLSVDSVGSATTVFGTEPFQDPCGKAIERAEWLFFLFFLGLPITDSTTE